jgi:hypothetical protein
MSELLVLIIEFKANLNSRSTECISTIIWHYWVKHGNTLIPRPRRLALHGAVPYEVTEVTDKATV